MASGTSAQEPRCNYVTLVKCFIDILDEWAWTLYELKDNVVTISDEQCAHLRRLDKCINDEGDEPHECTHQEMVEASNTVSDLLTHRKKSGSFLKSYYLLTYACSEKGQEILKNHRECLRQERIGEMTLSAGSYLSDKFHDLDDHEICAVVEGRLNEYMDATRDLCKNEAANLMCQSLRGMFQGLYPSRVGHCPLNCTVPVEEEKKYELGGRDFSDEANQAPGDQNALLPGAAGRTFASLASLVVGLVMIR